MALSLALKKIFPLTFSLLSSSQAQELMSEFEKDWSLEQLHFFPMLLKQKKLEAKIVEVADYEYLQFFLSSHTFSSQRSIAPLQVRPGLQTIWIRAAAEILNKTSGLYAIWKMPEGLREILLSKQEAQVLDRLREDQILLRTELEAGGLEALDQLIDQGLVLEKEIKTELNS